MVPSGGMLIMLPVPPGLQKQYLSHLTPPKYGFKKLGFGTGVWTLWYAAAPDCEEESNPHEHRPKLVFKDFYSIPRVTCQQLSERLRKRPKRV